ncbi:tyrosine-type recombinase/integrase [Streptomyces seoulensis]
MPPSGTSRPTNTRPTTTLNTSPNRRLESTHRASTDPGAVQADLVARPHMIRHSAATEWIRQGTDRSVVSDLRGHMSESSMAPYVHVDEGSRRAAVERADARRRELAR